MTLMNGDFKRKPAFTLVEVLIVLVLVGILAGLVMLSSGATIDTSQRAVCAANRRTIKSAYSVESAGSGKNFNENLKNAMEQFAQAAHNNMDVASDEAIYTGICPANGIYLININDDGKLNVFCSIEGHGGDEKEILDIKTLYEKVLEKYRQLAGNNKHPSGSELMEKLRHDFPEIFNLPFSYGGKELYLKSDVKWDGNALLYASEKTYDNGNYKFVAEYVYDNRNDKWYKCSPSLATSSIGNFKTIYNAIDTGKPVIGNKGEEITVSFTEVPDFKPF
ncbi:MAG: prepilin-type N-terminal cleavage/methylation domain-containing protein [Cloacibacillus sp.]